VIIETTNLRLDVNTATVTVTILENKNPHGKLIAGQVIRGHKASGAGLGQYFTVEDASGNVLLKDKVVRPPKM